MAMGVATSVDGAATAVAPWLGPLLQRRRRPSPSGRRVQRPVAGPVDGGSGIVDPSSTMSTTVGGGRRGGGTGGIAGIDGGDTI